MGHMETCKELNKNIVFMKEYINLPEYRRVRGSSVNDKVKDSRSRNIIL